LAERSPAAIAIEPIASMLGTENVCELAPLAETVITGVDDIEIRWLVQPRCPGLHLVGATSHFQIGPISTHVPGGPCAGCLHPRSGEDGGEIPTISFVSGLAGVLTAHRTVAALADRSAPKPTLAYGLALDERLGMMEVGLAAHPSCPVGCAAARAREAA
jgi:hypothetical protein